MRNQTQVQVPNPAVPQTIHIWMFATAAISTILVIPHAIVAATLHWPPTIANLHYVITLGFWLAGVVFVTRMSNQDAPESNSSKTELPSTKEKQHKQLSEVDVLEALLKLTDD